MAQRPSAGYSGTPLAKKLGIKAGTKLLAIGAPPDYAAWLTPLPADVSLIAKPAKGGCEMVHLFVASLADLDRHLPWRDAR